MIPCILPYRRRVGIAKSESRLSLGRSITSFPLFLFPFFFFYELSVLLLLLMSTSNLFVSFPLVSLSALSCLTRLNLFIEMVLPLLFSWIVLNGKSKFSLCFHIFHFFFFFCRLEIVVYVCCNYLNIYSSAFTKLLLAKYTTK